MVIRTLLILLSFFLSELINVNFMDFVMNGCKTVDDKRDRVLPRSRVSSDGCAGLATMTYQ